MLTKVMKADILVQKKTDEYKTLKYINTSFCKFQLYLEENSLSSESLIREMK